MDLNRWKIFRGLDPSLMSMCKLAKFISDPRVGFLVLQNDEVYVVNDIYIDARLRGNENHPEGAAVAGSQVSKVESLCGKGIIDFYVHKHGWEALSQGGCVYSWDYQLDINPESQGGIVPRLLLFPGHVSAQRVCQVSSGFEHNLCLTSYGQVFGWGSDREGQLGSGGSGLEYETDALKVARLRDNIVQVAAGGLASFTLDSDGMVWSWGSDTYSMLGHNRFYPSTSIPRRIENLNHIKKIAAGAYHVLALSESGELYFWGTFDHTTTTTSTPTRITIPSMEPVTDVGSIVKAPYAVFQTKDTVYLWGFWFGSYISEPKATQFASIDEAFASAESPTMLRPIAVNFQPHGVGDAWKREFDDPSVSDIVFSVDNENIHANAGFLKLRSEYFRNMLNGDWKESRKSGRPIEIQGFSFRVFKAFLYFLYQESLMDSDTMTVEDLAELMRAADFYGNGDLRLICENRLKSLLTLENACFVYTCAVKSNAENLQQYAAEFMAPESGGIVRSEEFAAMDNDGKRKLMIHFADLNVFPVPKRRRLE